MDGVVQLSTLLKVFLFTICCACQVIIAEPAGDIQQAPVFPDVALSGTVKELAANGTPAFTVDATDPSSDGSVTYSLFSYPSGLPFAIDPSSGVVSVEGTLDFETKTLYQFYVQATDQNLPPTTSSKFASISIIDDNDNFPHFAKSEFSISIGNWLPVETSVISVQATDLDKSDEGRLYYFIKPRNLDQVFGIDSTGEISLLQSLQSSPSTTYKLRVLVIDSVEHETNVNVTINVIASSTTSTNDQPVFDVSEYNINLSENTTFGTSFHQVTARIPSNPTADITYSLHQQVDSFLFSVSPSGQLMLLEALNFAVKSRYSITIEAKGSGDIVGTAQVNVNVQDTNDNSPQFIGLPYIVEVSELSIVGQIVAIVSATDGDPITSPFGQLQFGLRNFQEQFSMVTNGRNGIISLRLPLDADVIDQVTLSIEVKDRSATPLTAFTTVSIAALNVNDNNPVFTPNKATITINNTITAGSVIYNVTARDADSGSSVSYRLLDSISNRISVNAITGDVTLVQQFSFTTEQEYNVSIIAEDGGANARSSEFQLTIKVPKSSQIRPFFQPASYSVSIAENNPADSLVAVLFATDPDGIVSSYVMSANVPGAFKMTSSGLLLTNSSLNREEIASYNIEVQAIDDTRLGSSNVAQVEVTILDKNDNNPFFIEGALFTASVFESDGAGTFVTLVDANDIDEGNNGQIQFGFVDSSTSSLFTLDTSNGTISLATSLDREDAASHVFHVYVRDNGTPERQAVATVTVTVLDVNEAPRFSSESYVVSVSEAQIVPASIFTFGVTDSDEAPFNQFSLRIESQLLPGMFSIVSSNSLQVNGPLDYETTMQYTMTVRAVDSNNVNLYSDATMTVNVLNANDNQPIFQTSIHRATIIENHPFLSVIATVNATDADANTTLTYSIVPSNDANAFRISPSGNISTAKIFDYETKRRYAFDVLATDNGEPPLTGRSTVLVEVEDANDNRPFFTTLSIAKIVPSNTLTGSWIANIFVEDNDAGDNANVNLEISTSASPPPFAIIGRQIVVGGDLSIHAGQTIIFEIVAEDNGIPALVSANSLLVNISIVSSSTGGQRLIFFKDPDAEISVLESVIPLDVIYTPTLRQGNWTLITFDLLDTIDAAKFRINHQNGELRLKEGSQLNFNEQRIFSLVLVAQSGSISDQCVVNLRVVDINDHSPIFKVLWYLTYVAFNAPPGVDLLHVVATDQDTEASPNITYSILSGNNLQHFTMMSNGILRTASVDGYQTGNYVLHIKATDNGNPARNSTQDAFIQIDSNPISTTAPVFLRKAYLLTIKEGEIKELIPSLNAATGLVSVGSIKYKIASSDTENNFHLHPVTGALRNNVALDREKNPTYNIIIEAFNMNDANQKDFTIINIQVEDVNDNHPMFLSENLTISLPEDTQVGAVLGKVLTKDLDEGTNAELTFTLFPNNQISLNNKNELILSSHLDYENIKDFTVLISASDNGNPSLTTAEPFSVTIHVRDVNEFDPVFDQRKYVANLEELASVLTSITTVHAVDADHSDNQVRYSIPDPVASLFFAVNPTSGVVTNNEVFNYRLTKDYKFMIVAVDSGTRARRGYTLVEVTIMDINNHFPTVLETEYNVTLVDTVPYQYFVVQLRAEDLDTGVNGQLTYEIVTGNVNSAFIVDIQGAVRVISPTGLPSSSYSLSIKVKDSGDPPLEALRLITVHVQVENEDGNYSPAFSQSIFKANISESTGVGSLLLNVTASSRQIGAVLTFSIPDDGARQRFEIDSSNGEIRSKVKFDRETEIIITFCVAVTDSQGRSSVAKVEIILTDINDNVPRLIEKRISVEVKENAVIGTTVAALLARDPDEGDGGRVIYKIMLGNSNDAFTIDNNGLVSVSKSLDYESLKQYNLSISAFDVDTNVVGGIYETAEVLIQVTNVNDQPLLFSVSVYTKSVTENDDINRQLLTITAIDPDNTTTPVYEIVDETARKVFSLEPLDGILLNRVPLDYEKATSYRFCVKATLTFDNISLESIAFVHLTIVNVNERPIVMKSNYETEITTRLPINSTVLRLKAADEDSAENGKVAFIPISGNASHAFQLVGDVILLSRQLDEVDEGMYSWIFQVIDHGIPPLISNQDITVEISVTHFKNSRPMFQQRDYNVTISESFLVGPVLQVSALDSNKEDIVNYAIIESNAREMFNIDSTTGEIFLGRAADFESHQKWSFCVSAVDNASVPRLDVTRVDVYINDTNDNDPYWIQDQYAIDVADNLPIGSTILSLLAADAETKTGFLFSISSGDPEQLFNVNNEGEVIVTSRLAAANGNQFNLAIRVFDRGEPVRASRNQAIVSVNILKALLPPTFATANDLNISINESQTASVNILKIPTQEVHRPGSLTFSIVGSGAQAIFEISNDGWISSRIPLDYEVQSSYEFCVSIISANYTMILDTITVEITINNINDNAPMLLSTEEISILELSPIGTIVTVIEVSDPDIGPSGLSYSIIDGDSNNDFAIDNDGVITVKKQLVFNMKDYQLNLTVSDNADPPRETLFWRTISIWPQRNLNPSFQQTVYDKSIVESTSPIPSIVQVNAFGWNGRGSIRYSIEDEFVRSIFDIDSVTGILSSKARIEFTTNRIYTFCVIARDETAEGYGAIATVNLTVIDVNIPPLPTSFSYNVILQETASRGIVLRIPVVDSDEGLNGQLTYNIVSGNVNDTFAIDQNGVLSLVKSLDFEEKDHYQLKVAVSDQGDPALKSENDVIVDISIANVDNTPLSFSSSLYEVSVNETIAPISDLVKVSIGDASVQPNVTFTIRSQREDNLFFIDGISGMIRSIGSLDYETSRIHSFCVQASDGGNPPRLATSQVIVSVLDVNDNRPQLISQNYSVIVSEEQPLGYGIVALQAIDLDTGNNGQFAFTIISGNDDEIFAIDDEGKISLNKNLDYETNTIHELVISLKDKGNPSLASLRDFYVRIDVTGENDNTPKFQKDRYYIKITEDDSPILNIIQVTATDFDSCGGVSYSIIENESRSKFSIDSNGMISSIGPLSFDVKSTYVFTYRAEDSCIPHRSASVAVEIELNQANKFDPTWVISSYSTSISEATLTGSYVILLNAIDSDDAPNSDLIYTIEDGDTDGFFDIDNNGVITLKKALSSGKQNVYKLSVSVKDKGIPERMATSNAFVVINIENVFDPNPIFSQQIYTVDVNETSSTIALLTVNASAGIGTVTYSILNQVARTQFAMNSTTGVITNKQPLDYEGQTFVTFCVAATSNVGSRRTSMAFVSIKIFDVNEHAPFITPLRSHADVLENTAVGHVILPLIAYDGDGSEINKNLHFTIVGGSSIFEIDSIGQVLVKSPIDYETGPDEYTLPVRVQDNGIPPLSSVKDAIVHIVVVDENDNSPYFDTTLTEYSVPEDAPIDTSITRVNAIDGDKDDSVTYSFLESDVQKKFKINATSGEIQTNAILDYETETSYSMAVLATDSGLPPRMTSLSIVIKITNVNDNSPRFINAPPEIYLETTLPVQGQVFDFHAVDDDGDSVLYAIQDISGARDAFTINNETGLVSLTRNLIEATTYQMNVTASDSHGVSTLATMMLNVIEPTSRVDIPVISNKSSAASVLTVDLDLNNYIDDWRKMSEVWILIQGHHPDDPMFASATQVDPVSWYMVHVQGSIDNNKLKRYKAYKYVIPSSSGSRRRRDVIAYDDATGIITFIIGNQDGCDVITDEAAFCNGPLVPGQAYRLQIIGISPNGPPTTSGFSVALSSGGTPATFSASDQLLDEPYWIIGLCTFGALFNILTIAVAILVFYKIRPSSPRHVAPLSADSTPSEIAEYFHEQDLYYTTRAKRYQNAVYTHPESRFDQSTHPDELETFSNEMKKERKTEAVENTKFRRRTSVDDPHKDIENRYTVEPDYVTGARELRREPSSRSDILLSRTNSGRFLAFDAVKQTRM